MAPSPPTSSKPRLLPLVDVAENARDEVCTRCPLSSVIVNPADVCVTAQGVRGVEPEYVIVTRFPMSQRAFETLGVYLEEAGLDPTRGVYTSAARCRTFEMNTTRAAIKTCGETYLDAELSHVPTAKHVLVMGNEALQGVLGKSGIMKYRSKAYERDGRTVVPTIAHSAVDRNPGQLAGFKADLAYFAALVKGNDPQKLASPEIVHVKTKDQLKELVSALNAAHVVSYDIESASDHPGFLEKDPSSKIVSIAFTLADEKYNVTGVYALPLYHSQSPFRSTWEQVLRIIRPAFRRAPKSVAHNGKYDNRWLMHWNAHRRLTFDTMLAAHLLDENRRKSLKDLGYTVLGVPNWAIDTKNLLATPLDDVLHYNALDTFYTYHLYLRLRAQLNERPAVRRIFTRFMMPAANEFTEIEYRGVHTDRERLHARYEEAKGKLDEIESEIHSYIPDDHGFKEVNLNPSNFLRWLLFDHLQLTVLERGKSKEDGTPGAPSTREGVMTKLVDEHPIVQLLLDRVKWFKYTTAFLSAYLELIDDDDRIHTTFKLHGTTTGRLSSGKENDGEKISSKRQVRGVNLQQVPRDAFIRGLFGAPPGHSFLEADYSQVELRVAAYLAREETMLHLYKTGQDIHMSMAMRMTGKPQSQITKEERKKAKAVNFGFLYGMGWSKFVTTAWENYGVVVSDEEAQAFRNAFFDQFPQLLVWHRKQRQLVHKYHRVESPIGRIRHLPDVASKDKGVRAEAERQAINSPVQSFASDLILMSLVELHERFRREGFKTRSIGTVHDALNLEAPDDELHDVIPMIVDTMENLPLQEWFGVHLDVPLIADVKIGSHWGGARELERHEVFDYQGEESHAA